MQRNKLDQTHFHHRALVACVDHRSAGEHIGLELLLPHARRGTSPNTSMAFPDALNIELRVIPGLEPLLQHANQT